LIIAVVKVPGRAARKDAEATQWARHLGEWVRQFQKDAALDPPVVNFNVVTPNEDCVRLIDEAIERRAGQGWNGPHVLDYPEISLPPFERNGPGSRQPEAGIRLGNSLERPFGKSVSFMIHSSPREDQSTISFEIEREAMTYLVAFGGAVNGILIEGLVEADVPSGFKFLGTD
jgi:hypothetical protein